MTGATVRVRVVVSGRVQGVWFRDGMRRVARRVGASGWVRNVPDGRVEAEVEGSQAAVDAVVAWCHRGPPRARVESVDVSPIAPTGETGFRIAG